MNLDLLRQLAAMHDIAGFEGRVRAVVEREIAPLVDDVRTDRLGNLIATKRGTGSPTTMLAAHKDENRFLV